MRFVRPVLLIAAFIASFSAAAQTKILLGHTGASDYAAAFIAADQGIFKKHGLDVEIRQLPGPTLAPGLQSGSVQIAALPPSNVILAVNGGLKLMALAGTSVLSKGDLGYGLAAATNSNINTPPDLIGKKVGVPSLGGFLHVMTRKWLLDKGVDLKKVGFVEIPMAQMTDVLRGGSIEAVAAVDPFLARSIQSKAGRAISYFAADLPEGTTANFFTASREWIDKNPAAAAAFRDSIREAVGYAAANPEAVRASIGRYNKFPPDILATLALPHLSADVTEAQARFWVDVLRQQEMISGPFDPASLIAK